jgi:hypothetical protein
MDHENSHLDLLAVSAEELADSDLGRAWGGHKKGGAGTSGGKGPSKPSKPKGYRPSGAR